MRMRVCFLLLICLPTFGFDRPGDLEKLMDEGAYTSCYARATTMLSAGWRTPAIYRLQAEAAWASGMRSNAIVAAQAWVAREPEHLPAMVRLWQMLAASDLPGADPLLQQIDAFGRVKNPKTLDGPDLVAFGQAALALGEDPKTVLDACFSPAMKKSPGHLPAYLATAELGLDKRDFALAARTLQQAQKKLGDHPDIIGGLARAFFPSERETALALASQALSINSNHVASLLLQVEHAIDSEQYEAADAMLARIQVVNPLVAEAWALKAVLAVIRHDPATGDALRAKADRAAPGDPSLDVLIGRKISQKRRFEEGAAWQQRGLKLDPSYLPAQAEYAQDLLRLGREEEAWELLEKVHERDPYNVIAFNLMTLHDHLKNFESIRTEHFLIRMTASEAAIYGDRVQTLLEAAWRSLSRRYGAQLEPPIVVEFFPQQQDFAIRTLGMPGGLGLLGACFGRVITMNSPGSLGAQQSNWESTLWHEFCHAVTLGATRNRMPRWLTEGFSVYEEGQRDPVCQRQMNPLYRRLVLEKGLIPLEELSGSLMNFGNPQAIDFAYFESGLLVEFLVDRVDSNGLHQLIDDIDAGKDVLEALEPGLGKVETWWPVFAGLVTNQAEQFCAEADWATPEKGSPLHTNPAAVIPYAVEHPSSMWAREQLAGHRIAEEAWGDALREVEAMEALCDRYPPPLRFRVRIARATEDRDMERAALRDLLALVPDDPAACLRLLELDEESEDWNSVLLAGERQLAINPLLRLPHRALAKAYESQGHPEAAIRSWQRLLRLQPANPAEAHYRLATLLEDPVKQERHALQALEEAPRYRDAHRLLRSLQEAGR